MFFFDPAWYLRQLGGEKALARTGLGSEQHYHMFGAREGLSPNRYFDESWYLSEYPKVRLAVQEGRFKSGFHYYVVAGAAKQNSPNASFDEKWYLKNYPDVSRSVKSGAHRCGYEHYLLTGELEGRSPRRDFAEKTKPATPIYTPVVTTSPHVPPLFVALRTGLAASPRLNVALPSLQMQHMSGGPNTILNLVCRLADRGIPVRLLSCNTPLDDNRDAIWRHLSALAGVSGQVQNIETADASRPENPANIGENDTFLASAWWTAQMISQVLPHMRKRKYWYMIQDFEPGLYPWSSEYALALETYSHDILPILNTGLLRDYFVQNSVGRFADPEFARAAFVFEPAVDAQYFSSEPRLDKRPLRLLFYGRPRKAARNLFEIGLAALEMVASEGAFNSGLWEIRYIGDVISETRLSGDKMIRQLPWLGYESYAQLMRQSDILLSLMLSPHPSYPPLEMAACGGIVVTNTFDCKTAERLKQYSQHIYAAEPHPAAIADALRYAIYRVEHEPQRTRAQWTLHSNWAASFSSVIDGLVASWRKEHLHSAAGVAG